MIPTNTIPATQGEHVTEGIRHVLANYGDNRLRRFLNKFMALARRGGREQSSIYKYKLRDRVPGSDEQFISSLECLKKHKCIEEQLAWISLTPLATQHMYSYRPEEALKAFDKAVQLDSNFTLACNNRNRLLSYLSH
jgi:hypothetical protein